MHPGADVVGDFSNANFEGADIQMNDRAPRTDPTTTCPNAKPGPCF